MAQVAPDPSHDAAPRLDVLRSQLGRARGLGTARAGTGHWWAQRVTAMALLPLSVWFVAYALHLAGAARAQVAHSVAHPLNATLLLATILALFHHAQLGLQVVIEDYVRGPARKALILAMQAAAALLALACAVAVLRLALAG